MFHSLYIYISFSAEQGKHCIKLTQLFFSLYLYILPTLSSFDFGRTERKRNCGLIFLSLFFCVITFSLRDWLTQGSSMSKKRYDRFSLSFMFLRIPLSSMFEASYDSKGKFGFLACQSPCLLSCRRQAYLELILNLVELPYAVDPLEFCAHWASPKLYENDVERNVRYAFSCVSSAHVHVALSQQISFKTQIQR